MAPKNKTSAIVARGDMANNSRNGSGGVKKRGERRQWQHVENNALASMAWRGIGGGENERHQ